MKDRVLVVGLVCALATPVLAQDVIRRSQDATELRADWVLGTTVATPGGETIGTVDSLLLDEEEGNVTAAIVSVGGFLGFGAKQIAVNWEDLELEYDASEITLDLSREDAEGAPEFDFRDQQLRPPPQPATGQGTGGLDTGTAPAPPQ